MLILLPPSEGKSAPGRGTPLDLALLDFPELTEAREEMLAALLRLCPPDADDEQVGRAADVLALGPTQLEHVVRNARLLEAPTARADRIYTGVLYDALDLPSLDAPARRRATRWLVVMSALFGVVRPGDRIPSYRLSGDTRLPDLGVVSAYWRRHLDQVLTAAAGSGLVVDLRSTTYAAFWRSPAALAGRVVTVRVLQQVGDQRKVVSHFNKATKGRLVRDLLIDGGSPRTASELADHLTGLGWKVEAQEATRGSQALDVVV